VDVSRAYFNARTNPEDKPCYVNLPDEDCDSSTQCGLLLRHMYGTRPAADGWQEEYSTMLIQDLGFEQGTSSPNIFFHRQYGIVCSVHGDDFTSSGPKPSLDWLEDAIGRRYEITIGPRLGPGDKDGKEATVLNRIVRWCGDSQGQWLEYEADPRQAERLIGDCGLEGAKPVATPGVRSTTEELERDKPLEPRLHTAFRGAAARGNYLSVDRLDCHYACKEVCRWMAHPSEASWTALKRLGRYLAGLPRLVYTYREQEVEWLDAYTDTDWAGCPRTRKSTNGGCLLLGTHTIKHWSSTQAGISLSSGEAEFNGVVRGAGQALGYQSLLKDLGVELPIRLWTDSSAAIGICSRQGLGKVRHLDTYTLWVQQAVRSGRINLKKVRGDSNPADLFTKHSLTRDKLMQLTKLFDCHFRDGRAASAPMLRRGKTSGVKIAEADSQGEICAIADANQWASGILDPEGEHDDAKTEPCMPHSQHSAELIDKLYPSLKVPEELDLDDAHLDAWDLVYQRGLREAQTISEDMHVLGRMKYMRSRETQGGRSEVKLHGSSEEYGQHTPGCRVAVA